MMMKILWVACLFVATMGMSLNNESLNESLSDSSSDLPLFQINLDLAPHLRFETVGKHY